MSTKKRKKVKIISHGIGLIAFFEGNNAQYAKKGKTLLYKRHKTELEILPY